MANYKITALSELTNEPSNGDYTVIVDVSDTTMADTGTTKKFNVGKFVVKQGTTSFNYLGSVAIGNVTSPTIPFEVRANPSEVARFSCAGVTASPMLSLGQAANRRAFMQYLHTGSALSIAAEYGPIIFRSASTLGSDSDTEYVRFDVGGNVGIGTASPSAKLDVAGTVQMNALKLNQTPTEGEFTATHYITVNLNGTDYRIACAAY